jgi:hypothetical protein
MPPALEGWRDGANPRHFLGHARLLTSPGALMTPDDVLSSRVLETNQGNILAADKRMAREIANVSNLFKHIESNMYMTGSSSMRGSERSVSSVSSSAVVHSGCARRQHCCIRTRHVLLRKL